MPASFVNVTWRDEGSSKQIEVSHIPHMRGSLHTLVPFSTPASPVAPGRHEIVNRYLLLH